MRGQKLVTADLKICNSCSIQAWPHCILYRHYLRICDYEGYIWTNFDNAVVRLLLLDISFRMGYFSHEFVTKRKTHDGHIRA